MNCLTDAVALTDTMDELRANKLQLLAELMVRRPALPDGFYHLLVGGAGCVIHLYI